MNQIQRIYVFIHRFTTKNHYLYKEVTDVEGETKIILHLSLTDAQLDPSSKPSPPFWLAAASMTNIIILQHP